MGVTSALGSFQNRHTDQWRGFCCLIALLCGGCASSSQEPGGTGQSSLLESGRYEQTSSEAQITWVFQDNNLFERVQRRQGADGATRVALDWGRWWPDSGQRKIITQGERVIELVPAGVGDLRVRDSTAAEQSLLFRTGQADPLAVNRSMTLCFMTQADAPLAYEPKTRRHFPVLLEAAYPALEKAYLDSGLKPPSQLPVAVRGRWALAKAPDGAGQKLHVRVAALEQVIPGKATTCPLADLTETFWALESLDGQPVSPGEGQREINLRLRRNGEALGLAGCNRFTGAFERRADNLSFGDMATTKMMCPDRADTETQFLKMLGNAKRFAIEGETLYLMDATGRDLAVFGARYF